MRWKGRRTKVGNKWQHRGWQHGFCYHLHGSSCFKSFSPSTILLLLSAVLASCISCVCVLLSQLFHVMLPLFRGFLAALAFHFDSLRANKKKKQKNATASSLSFFHPASSLPLSLSLSLAAQTCSWLVAFALSADSHKFCFAFHFYFIYMRLPPSQSRYPCLSLSPTHSHAIPLSLSPSLLPCP